MKVLTDLDFNLEDTAVCIGKFDGFHRGHRALVREAEKSGLTTVRGYTAMGKSAFWRRSSESIILLKFPRRRSS